MGQQEGENIAELVKGGPALGLSMEAGAAKSIDLEERVDERNARASHGPGGVIVAGLLGLALDLDSKR